VKTLLCVLCFLCGPVFSFGLDRHAFTFTDYDLTVTLDPAKSGFSAQGTVTLRNDTGEPQKLAVLQVSSTLDWRAITVGGKAVQYVSQLYTSDIDHTGALSEAIVTLPSALLPNQSVKLDIAYAGTIAQDATRLTRIGVPEKLAARSDWDRIAGAYGALRGVGYVAWYPIATEAQSLSDGSSVFREIGAWRQREAAASMRVALAGADHTLHTTGSPAPGCSESKAECSTWNPVGWSVPALLYGVYQELARPGSEIAYLPGRQPLAEDYARVITQITPFVAQWFGTPSRPVRIFEVAWPDSASWESGAMLLTPLKQSLPDPLQLELVHQVTHAVLRSPRPWIFEGAAEFAQALERERQAGRRAGIAFMEAQSSPLTAAQQPLLPNAPGRKDAAPSRPLQPLVTTSDEVFYRIKAMRVWWMLRDLVGEAALQRAFHAYKPADDRDPSYMQRLIEAETLRKLEWFFDDWVYRDRGLPDFRIAAVYPREILGGGYTVTITVENLGDAAAEVPITVETSHGRVSKRLQVHGRDKAFLRMEVPEAPRRVVVNDGSVPELDRVNNSFEVKIPGK